MDSISVKFRAEILRTKNSLRYLDLSATPDIQVGNQLVSDQKRALRVSSGVHSMRLLQLVRVDA